MSTLRKTVLTTAIIGAGLASTAGSAFATDCDHEGHHQHHHQSSSSTHGSSCTNNVTATNSATGGAFSPGVIAPQTVVPINACHILNDNTVLSGNTL